MNTDSPIKVEKNDHIAWVTLNRPEKRNALNIETLERMLEVFRELDNDDDTRAIVVNGKGKSFCAGLELSELAGLIEKSTADYREKLRRFIVYGQTSTNIIEACHKPVISAVHGYCVGGGVDLVCACDIRLATKDAIFSVRETRLALVADLGTLQRLPAIIGESWARELALTGRDFSGEEALKMGFVTHLCENSDELFKKAEALAGEIASNPPLAVQGVKDTMRFSRAHGVSAGLQYVAQKNAAILISEDGFEAIAAAIEKRKPVFKGR
jgi:enoyl-CoA hydratase